MKYRFVYPTLVGAMALLALLPNALLQATHGDEAEYIWSAAYFGRKIAHLDFDWDPLSYWSRDQPMGARYVYALTLELTHAAVPEHPYLWSRPEYQYPDVWPVRSTVIRMRIAALVCAAIGLALIVFRLGIPAVLASAVFLAIPHVSRDLARAWAEGPLLLSFGIAVVSFGCRWFGCSAALAATVKLTGLALWPVLVLPEANGRNPKDRWFGLPVTLLVWTILSPPSWLSGGPFYLFQMAEELAAQVASHRHLSGLVIPTRYAWPFELGALLLVATEAVKYARSKWGHVK